MVGEDGVSMLQCNGSRFATTATNARTSLVATTMATKARHVVVHEQRGGRSCRARTAFLLLGDQFGVNALLLVDNLFLAPIGVGATLVNALRNELLLLRESNKHRVRLASPTATKFKERSG
jgi:hypothetical protein